MASEAKIMQFPQKSPYRPETADRFDIQDQPDIGPGWFNEMRQESFEKFKAQGLPTPALERWKYTNIIPLLKDFSLNFEAPDFETKCELPYISSLVSLADRDEPWIFAFMQNEVPEAETKGDMALWHLSTAYLRRGMVVDIPAETVMEKPVEIILKGNEGKFTCPRTIIRVGEGSEVTVIEKFKGEGRYWKNRVTQIVLGRNAVLHHYRLQEDSPESVYTQTTHITQERDSTYETFAYTEGARLSRNQVYAELKDENCTCNFYGLNLQKDNQHADNTILVEHQAPHCQSNQFIRTLLDDQARGVFQGKVYVDQKAQKTDGYQLSNTILLSEGAEMDTKPELEIYADDVKCSHGATTGQLDEEPLFYLRSRGLSEKEARHLLLQAFVDEVTDKIADQDFKALIEQKTQHWLQQVL